MDIRDAKVGMRVIADASVLASGGDLRLEGCEAVIMGIDRATIRVDFKDDPAAVQLFRMKNKPHASGSWFVSRFTPVKDKDGNVLYKEGY